jgi:hypothetical protein
VRQTVDFGLGHIIAIPFVFLVSVKWRKPGSLRIIEQTQLETMHATELEDWGRFGKIRQAEEKRLRDPDDVFIHVQERKEEIARERRKTKRKK